MSILASEFLKLSLIRRENEINYRLTELNNKLGDLQRYSSNIGDGTISMNTILNVPASYSARAMAFMNYSHNGSIMGAQRNMQMMGPQIQMQMQQMQQAQQNNPQAMQMYQQWIFNNLYTQELQKFQKQETKLLNQQEQEIQKEKARLSTELQMVKAQYENANKVQQESLQRLRA